ncbi:hypothetical protein HDV57DRAFT_116382 [Trichoderma longibrachiatum]|uniref:2EXR domain-containing protein n=1 Tax=Trichoderma longibrachiatum ATCC 18648 TaxID=983965 RepID=A0A2T4BUB3_TRILO|nr:hypothetical protein M440DRAFT_1394649 [Trichoderma longibrachiatum ATCC 18648]
MGYRPPVPGRTPTRKTRSWTAAKARRIDKNPSPKPDLFHSFARLPAELRLKIWEASIPGPRLVSIQCGSNISFVSKPSPSIVEEGCTSTAPTPACLHACAESRAEALKIYRPSFGFFRKPGHVWFNPKVDIMYFGPRQGFMAADSQFHTCMALCDPAELASVRRLAVNDALFWIGATYNSMTAASLTLELLRQVATRMPGVDELIFVPWEAKARADKALALERMTWQIQTAINLIPRMVPSWQPPPWKIVPLSQLPSPTG